MAAVAHQIDSSPSAHFAKISDEFGIDGSVTDDGLNHLVENYKSVLYLCTDDVAIGDCGAIGGFQTVLNAFSPTTAVHIPLNPSHSAYQSECSQNAHYEALLQYSAYESALDSLPRPTVILCKSARRAGAVLNAYVGVKKNQTAEEMNFSLQDTSKFFSYLSAPGLKNWTDTILNIKSDKIEFGANRNTLIFRQMFEKESCTYTYLLADSVTGDAILIDPVMECAERDISLIKDLKLSLKYGINTHVHADHTTGTGKMKVEHGIEFESVLSIESGGVADKLVNDMDRIYFGTRYLTCVSTPGHTAGCISLILDDYSRVFTGDTLLIRRCGRTDFQGENSTKLYNSVHEKLFCLPDNCLVFPAHDYKGLTSSTIKEEKDCNPRLNKSLDEFVILMENLNLPYPKKIDASLPANLKCGIDI